MEDELFVWLVDPFRLQRRLQDKGLGSCRHFVQYDTTGRRRGLKDVVIWAALAEQTLAKAAVGSEASNLLEDLAEPAAQGRALVRGQIEHFFRLQPSAEARYPKGR